MYLEEKIKKLEVELENLGEKEKKIAENKKEIRNQLAEMQERLEAEKNQKIAALLENQLGDLSEEKLRQLEKILETHADEIRSFADKEEDPGEKNIPKENREVGSFWEGQGHF